jgi:exopolyphosphatase/guanosine-5'-triphosphate,3'-diphosphate pyrophosphatase
MRTAVVDMGTNSTRLLVADVEPGGELREVVRESLVTRLGDGLEAGGRLRPDARERVLGVVARYARVIAEQGAERALAVMTSAVRDAADGADFAAELTARTGLEGTILGGDEEAALTFAGATATRSPDGLLVVDIGGGSTELVAAGFHASMQVGVVRHGERHLHDDPPTPAQLGALAADVRATIAAARPPGLDVREIVAVAGTATSCASIDLGLEVYDTRRIEGHVLDRATLEALRDRLAALPLTERRRVTGLHPDRAPVIVPGILILLEVLDAFGSRRLLASDRDILHGAARALAGEQIPRMGGPI